MSCYHCEYVDIGVGFQMVAPSYDCPDDGHRASAFSYYDGLTGDELDLAVRRSSPDYRAVPTTLYFADGTKDDCAEEPSPAYYRALDCSRPVGTLIAVIRHPGADQ